MNGPTIHRLAGNRLHLQHGPIDLIVWAEGEPQNLFESYRVATETFPEILPRLCDELPLLRMRITDEGPFPLGPIAQRMLAACQPYRAVYITPMAAVAGAVADHVLAAMLEAAPLDRAFINNGGDIAFHLGPGRALTAGLVADLSLPRIDATITLDDRSPPRGMATSGWRGRSQSLGIADSVTILAANAAEADAAATIVANAVDVEDPGIRRQAARLVKADSDLGDLLVTTGVDRLTPEQVGIALGRGAAMARRLLAEGLIHGAIITLQDRSQIVGPVPLLSHNTSIERQVA